MRMSSEPSREEIDRLRGLARAAWARLQRGDDLDDEQSASAQEEYARTRDELLDLGIGIEVTERCSSAKRGAVVLSAAVLCESSRNRLIIEQGTVRVRANDGPSSAGTAQRSQAGRPLTDLLPRGRLVL